MAASGNDAVGNLDNPRGKVTALIGRSECGKSTLIRSVKRINDLIDGDMRPGKAGQNEKAPECPGPFVFSCSY